MSELEYLDDPPPGEHPRLDEAVVAALAKRLLSCERPWVGLVLFRGLPELIEHRRKPRALRRALAFLGDDEHRERSLAALRGWLAAAGTRDFPCPAEVPECTSWRRIAPRVFVEHHLGLDCETIGSLKLGHASSYGTASFLATKTGCSAPAELVAQGLQMNVAAARRAACGDIRTELYEVAERERWLPFGERVARAVVTPAVTRGSTENVPVLEYMFKLADQPDEHVEVCTEVAIQLRGTHIVRKQDQTVIVHFGHPSGFGLQLGEERFMIGASPWPEEVVAKPLELEVRGADGWKRLDAKALPGDQPARWDVRLVTPQLSADGAARLWVRHVDGRVTEAAIQSP